MNNEMIFAICAGYLDTFVLEERQLREYQNVIFGNAIGEQMADSLRERVGNSARLREAASCNSSCKSMTSNPKPSHNALDAQSFSERYGTENGVAIIEIEGTIRKKSHWLFAGEGLWELERKIELALQDPNVHSILYVVDSGGGSTNGLQALASTIAEAKKIKPCATFVDGVCYSAAYWIGSATGAVYATESASVGSIGVVIIHCEFSKYLETSGEKYSLIHAGSKKIVGNPYESLSKQDREVLQDKVNALYDIFVQNVAQNMKLDEDKKEIWADGRIFLGKEAHELGLVTKVVRNKKHVLEILQNKQEKRMDKETLKKQFPDLYAEIMQEGASVSTLLSENSSGNDEEKNKNIPSPAPSPTLPTALSPALVDAMAFVQAVAGDELANQITNLMSLGISADQYKAITSMHNIGISQNSPKAEPLEKNTPDANNQDNSVSNGQSKEEAILQGLLNAHAKAVDTDTTKQITNEEKLIMACAKV